VNTNQNTNTNRNTSDNSDTVPAAGSGNRASRRAGLARRLAAMTLVAGAAFGVASTGPFVAAASAACGPEPVKICPTGPSSTGPSSTGPVVVDVDPTPAPSQMIPGGRFRAPDFRADRPVNPDPGSDDGADNGGDDGGSGTADRPGGSTIPNGGGGDAADPGPVGSPIPPSPIDLPNGPFIDPDSGGILPGQPATPTGDPVDTAAPADAGAGAGGIAPTDAGDGGAASTDADQTAGDEGDVSTSDSESSDGDRAGFGIDSLAFTGSGDTLVRLGAVLAVGGVAAVATAAAARKRREG